MRRGFTLIELLVVMAIIATLLTIATPRYFAHLDHAKEVALQETLATVRDAIDKYHADTGRYPADLDDLVTKRYLRKRPIDPLTDSADTWIVLPAANAASGMGDIRSGAVAEGKAYADW
jgi:general secretion pathway protein G